MSLAEVWDMQFSSVNIPNIASYAQLAYHVVTPQMKGPSVLISV